MSFSFYKLCSSIGIAFTLTGCLSTSNLVRDSNGFSESNQRIIQLVAEKAKDICLTGRHRENGGKKTFVSGVPISQALEIRRIYISNTNWYKFQAITRGIFDHVYYNWQTSELKCGDISWQEDKVLAGIVFVELTSGSPEALATPAPPVPAPAAPVRAPLKQPTIEPAPTENRG